MRPISLRTLLPGLAAVAALSVAATLFGPRRPRTGVSQSRMAQWRLRLAPPKGCQSTRWRSGVLLGYGAATGGNTVPMSTGIGGGFCSTMQIPGPRWSSLRAPKSRSN